MQRLLDHVSDIPALLAEHDILAAAADANTMSQSELHNRRLAFWASLSDIESRLHQWKAENADCHPAGQPYEVPVEIDRLQESPGLSCGDNDFPTFQYRDLSTLEIVTPTLIMYPDHVLARTLCLYYAVLLVMSRIDTRPDCGMQPFEQHRLACLICRSIKYFIRTAPGSLILRIMFPLGTACNLLAEGSLEKELAQAMFLWISRTRSIGSSLVRPEKSLAQTK